MSRYDLAKVTPKSVSDHDTIIDATVCAISDVLDMRYMLRYTAQRSVFFNADDCEQLLNMLCTM